MDEYQATDNNVMQKNLEEELIWNFVTAFMSHHVIINCSRDHLVICELRLKYTKIKETNAMFK